MYFAPMAEGEYPQDIKVLNNQWDRLAVKTFRHKQAGFYAPLLCSLQHVWTYEVDRAATDGMHLFFNPQWFMSIKPEVREATLMHELKHVAYLHLPRGIGKDNYIWNIACDVEINGELHDTEYTFGSESVVHMPEYAGWTVEHIYLDLLKNPPPLNGGGDDMLDPAFESTLGTKPKDSNHMIECDSKDAAKIANKVSYAIKAAEKSGKAGDIPGGAKDALKNVLTPKVRWEEVILNWGKALIKTRRSYRRPNRRYLHEDILVKSMVKERKGLDKIHIYWDVSGSVSLEIATRFLAETAYVFDVLNPKELKLIQFDTEIQKEDDYFKGTIFEVPYIHGRGGTCLGCVRDHIIETNPTGVIVFTDMGCEPMQSLPIDIPVLWAVAGESRFWTHTPLFGTRVNVE